MNICIIGDGLTSLSLAQNLINKKINVHIYKEKKINNLIGNRTIGISKNNFEFFNRQIQKIPKKNIWKIKKIEIYTEKNEKSKILNFEEDNNNLFYILKNDQLYKSLNKKLIKNKLFKRKIVENNNFYQNLIKNKKYDLVINCNPLNFIGKKYFFRKINKNYHNLAYTTILNHEKIDNHTAIQIFTKLGPIAFLPMSNTQTSVVYSIDINEYQYNQEEILVLINKHNPKFQIKKILKLQKFKLESSTLRNYYYKNILAFGDSLHKVHPLAGQGFNMTIRDIEVFSKIIKNRVDLGLQLDELIFKEFEEKTKHFNFIFFKGIDFIYEFFHFDKKIKNKKLNELIKYIGGNKKLNNILIKYANTGLNIY